MHKSTRDDVRLVLMTSSLFLAAAWWAATTTVAETKAPEKAAATAEDAKPAEKAQAEVPTYTQMEKPAEGLTLATLSNGLTVHRPGEPRRPGGHGPLLREEHGQRLRGPLAGAGLSHVLEHVVAGGTTTNAQRRRKSRQIIDTFGGATNAYTSHRHDGLLHRLPGQARDDLHRTGGRLDAARQVRAVGVRARAEGRPARTGRRRGRIASASSGRCSARRSTPSTRRGIPMIGYLDVLRTAPTAGRSSTSTASATCPTTRSSSWSAT